MAYVLISLEFNSPLLAAKKLKLHWKPSVYEQNIFHTPPACGGEILIAGFSSKLFI
jgi:hypothetical protein